MRWAHPVVLALLVTEGLGGLTFGILTLVIGEQITPGYVPWSFAAAPLIFGATAVSPPTSTGAGFPWRNSRPCP